MLIRNREFKIVGWTTAGPAFTISRPAAGWRNRKARRAGEREVKELGPHDLLETSLLDPDMPMAAMLTATKVYEIWAFKAGHVYAIDLIDQVQDGDVLRVAFDAREEDLIEIFRDELQMLEWRALEGEELEATLAAGQPIQPDNFSDGAESQEPAPNLVPGVPAWQIPQAAVDATSAPLEETLSWDGSQTITVSDLFGHEYGLAPGEYGAHTLLLYLHGRGSVELAPEALEHLQSLQVAEDAATKAAAAEPVAEVEVPEPPIEPAPEAELETPAESTQPPAADADEPSTGDADYAGKVDEFKAAIADISDDELLRLSTEDSRVGVRDAAAHELDKRTS